MKVAGVAFALTALTAGTPSQAQSLQQQLTVLTSQVKALQTQLAAIQANPALALGPFVSVDPNPQTGVAGPNVTFKGINLHLVSGSGATNDNGTPRGLGNLILGYDEDPGLVTSIPLNAGDRGGSHNLVIGRWHRFTRGAFGGLVAGEQNTLSNQATSVSGGFRNTASGVRASVSGGELNTASSQATTVSGGAQNTASAEAASVLGGLQNTASAPAGSVSGGLGNTANGVYASVLGGQQNTTSGAYASVLGGLGNTAAGQATVVLGGTNVTDANFNAIAPTVAP